jgi:hypothetical protein
MKRWALCVFVLWWGTDKLQAQAAPDIYSQNFRSGTLVLVEPLENTS